MKHIGKYKWFWFTFGTWCFITSVGAWALIYSPFHLNTRLISEFSSEVNKFTNKNQIFLNSSPIGVSLNEITGKWEAEGWRNITGNINLAKTLIKIPDEFSGYLDQLVQVRAFEKKDSLRVLGLLETGKGAQTYQWVSEMPKESLKAQDPSKVDFPLKPPSESSNVITLKTKYMETLTWSHGSKTNISGIFSRVYSSQGFSGQLLNKINGESFYILRRGPTKLLAVLEEGENNRILVAKVNKI